MMTTQPMVVLFTLHANPVHDHKERATTITGSLSSIRRWLVSQSDLYGWNLGDFSAWGLDQRDRDPCEIVPELNQDTLLACASLVWDIPPAHIALQAVVPRPENIPLMRAATL